ncbi:ASP-1 protein, partial [Aphelenchoides avenae]
PAKTSQLTERGGALVLGSKDSQNCESSYSQWISVDTTGLGEFSWGFVVNSFAIGSYVTTEQTVQLQSQTTFIYAPTQVFNGIVRLAGAEYDFHTDRYTVKCAKAKSLPAMVFTFGSFKYSVPATDYVRMIGDDYARDDGVCTLAVMDAGPVFFKCCQWILGTTFNFEYCHLLDYGNKRIAFAKALAPKSD